MIDNPARPTAAPVSGSVLDDLPARLRRIQQECHDMSEYFRGWSMEAFLAIRYAADSLQHADRVTRYTIQHAAVLPEEDPK